jgi:hypothetical protein
LGPIEYFAQIVRSGKVILDPNEHYLKQTFRNRCIIATANGRFPLIIPVFRPNGNHTKVKDVQITYSEKWQQLHWRTLNAAYSHSPFMLYYQDMLESFYQTPFNFLFDFNQQLMDLVLGFLKIKQPIEISELYMEDFSAETLDYRNVFSPKKRTEIGFPPYIQVFSERHGFIPNLSILDLLFNEGPASLQYLQNL